MMKTTPATAFKEATKMTLVLEMLDSKRAFAHRHKWNLSEPVKEMKFIDLVNGIERKVGKFRPGHDNDERKHLEIYCTKHRTLVNTEREWHELVVAYIPTSSSPFVVYIRIEPTSRLVVDEDRDTVVCVSEDEQEEELAKPEKQYSFLQQLMLDLVDKDQALVEQMLMEHAESVLVYAEHVAFSRSKDEEAFSNEFVEKLRQGVLPVADFDLVVVDEEVIPVGSDVSLQVATTQSERDGDGDVIWAEIAEEEELQVQLTGPDFIFVAHESDLDWFVITVTNMSLCERLPEGLELRYSNEESVSFPIHALAPGESQEVKVKYELCSAHVKRTLMFNHSALAHAVFTYEVYVEQEDEAFARKEKDAALAHSLAAQDEQARLAEEQRSAALAHSLATQDEQARLTEEQCNAAVARELVEQDKQMQLEDQRNVALAQQLAEQERLKEEQRTAALAQQLAEQERLKEEQRNAALAQERLKEEQRNAALAQQLAAQERLKEEQRNAALAQQLAAQGEQARLEEEQLDEAFARELSLQEEQEQEQEQDSSAILAETLQREEEELEARARLDADLAVCIDQEECNGAMGDGIAAEANDDEAFALQLQNELDWDMAQTLSRSFDEERNSTD